MIEIQYMHIVPSSFCISILISTHLIHNENLRSDQNINDQKRHKGTYLCVNSVSDTHVHFRPKGSKGGVIC